MQTSFPHFVALGSETFEGSRLPGSWQSSAGGYSYSPGQ